ncbi:unnamed protein product [Clonostachys byssicola]|uniref:NB-ARC domain-containing protein n=1 Tax=Clonostachys byssicola TaxID=160290 RepID=A0A9N9V1M9_9HYPO|nr:unnamed protein product [Clonostachys byssicola]
MHLPQFEAESEPSAPKCPEIQRDGITVLQDGGECTIDVVLLHGLNGSPENTWKHATSGFYWPWELSKQIPYARVMVFGYDADIKTSLSTSLARIQDLGTAFLTKLGNFRQKKEERDRPLIFIGHSLGGLVIKQALWAGSLEGKLRANSQSRIYNATKGLIFFGTPHLGSQASSQKRVQFLQAIASLAFTQIPPKIEAALKSHSDELFDLSGHFAKTTLCLDRRVLVTSFYEKVTDSRLGAEVVDQTSAELRYGLEDMVPIFRNHQDMVKFENANDQDFQTVGNKISDIKEFIDENVAVADEIPNYPPTPMSPAKTLIARTSLLDDIKTQFSQRPTGLGQSITVGIWGMGGIGKSQLALEYLSEHGKRYQLWFWIQAGDPASVDQHFRNIYNTIPFDTQQPVNPTSDAVRLAVLQFLNRKPRRLLIVFDGADHLHPEDKNYVNIGQYIPQNAQTHVIITSRNSNAARNLSTFDGVAIDILQEEDAISAFFKSAGKEEPSADDRANAKQIVKVLGYLPLAISLAGSYVGQTPRIFSDLSLYLEEYKHRKTELWKRKDIHHHSNHSVMTVWETSYLAVLHQSPNTCRLLSLLSFLNNEGIHINLFTAAESSTASMFWEPAVTTRDQASIHDVEQCLAILESYTMIQRNPSDGSYKMHSLVHDWCLERLRQNENKDIANRFALAAVQLIQVALKKYTPAEQWRPEIFLFPQWFSEAGGETPDEIRTIPHLRAALRSIDALGYAPEAETEVLGMLEELGEFLDNSQRWADASQLWSTASQIAERCLWVDPSKRFDLINRQARSFFRLGDVGKAEEVLVGAVETASNVLGKEHEATIDLGMRIRSMEYMRDFLKQLAVNSAHEKEKLKGLQEGGEDDAASETRVRRMMLLEDSNNTRAFLEEMSLVISRAKVTNEESCAMAKAQLATVESALCNLEKALETIERDMREKRDMVTEEMAGLANKVIRLGAAQRISLKEGCTAYKVCIDELERSSSNYLPQALQELANVTDLDMDQAPMQRFRQLLVEMQASSNKVVLHYPLVDTTGAIDFREATGAWSKACAELLAEIEGRSHLDWLMLDVKKALAKFRLK